MSWNQSALSKETGIAIIKIDTSFRNRYFEIKLAFFAH